MYFVGLFDCSKGHFNKQSLKATVRSRVVLHIYYIEKEIIGFTLTLFRLGFFDLPGQGGVKDPPSPPFLKNYRRYRHETYTTN